MGFECFKVHLSPEEPNRLLSTLIDFGFTLAATQGDSNYKRLELVTESFIIEADLHRARNDLSIEFALCNPPEALTAFKNLLLELLRSSPSEVWLMNSATKGKIQFRKSESDDAIRQVDIEMPLLQKAWLKAFGPATGPMRVKYAYHFVEITTNDGSKLS